MDLIYAILISPLLTILGVYLFFGKIFMGQKGKNLATKQDIGKITDEIEKVKQEYTKGIERFKSQTDLIASNYKEHYKDSKKVIMNFYDAYTLWWNHTTDESTKSLAPKETKFGSWMELNYELEKEVIIHQKRFELFINNEQLKNEATVLVKDTKGIFINILTKDLIFDPNKSKKEVYIKKCKKDQVLPDEDIIKQLNEEHNNKLLQFNTMLQSQKDEVLKLFNNFGSSLRSYFDKMHNLK